MQRLSLISWNIDAFSLRAISRTKLILSHILEGPKSPNIAFLQEVTPDVRASLLKDARVRAVFLAIDAEDQTLFEKVPFGQKENDGIEEGEKFMLGASPEQIWEGCALCGDHPLKRAGHILPSHQRLDSLGDTLHYRTQQMEILANTLREPGCGGGIIAGDFNAISPEDDGLVDKNKLVDA